MLKDNIRAIIKASRRPQLRQSSADTRRPQLRWLNRDARIAMWYGGQRMELPVEAWMRGH